MTGMNQGEVSGRCRKCNVRYVWQKRTGGTLKGKRCPRCSQQLRATTHLFKGQTADLDQQALADAGVLV